MDVVQRRPHMRESRTRSNQLERVLPSITCLARLVPTSHPEEPMSNPPTTPRRLAIALTAAVASTTLAVGVTAASLMGWFGRTAPSPAASASSEPAVSQPVILVPITPLQPERPAANLQLAMDERSSYDGDDDERDHDKRREHDDRHEVDDE
ncbi:MAG TPA: hypothetical protein VFQ65_28725 [Kofleriaceae bacterium]|nr:hypothetical protein [Kofleriaceae bacterium]